jgi:hypothetical protein
MVPYRPVMQVEVAPLEGILLFAGNRSILAWGKKGLAWESERLSDEGLTIVSVEGGALRGTGWEMRSDLERAFTLDAHTGIRLG